MCLVWCCQQANKPSWASSLLTSLHRACNKFVFFFTGKKSHIQCLPTCQGVSCPCVHFSSSNMTQFYLINQKTLEDITQHLKSYSCYLEILSTGFFKITNCNASDHVQIVNRSFLSGFFPQALKTAVIKPPLKEQPRKLTNEQL